MPSNQTIACLLTPSQATGGIAVIQITGPQALVIFRKYFQGKKDLTQEGKLYYGFLYGEHEKQEPPIDEILLHFKYAANSPTKRDLVELSCHGGRAIIAKIFDFLAQQGVAQVGYSRWLEEFPLGRVRQQAWELVLESKTELAARVFTYQYNGALHQEMAEISQLCGESPNEAQKRLQELLQTVPLAEALQWGKKLVIAGHPNAGKSTLINHLLGHERVLVDPQPGTTRDVVSVWISLAGVPFQVMDTAGLREAQEQIEKMGISAAEEILQQADLICWVIDASVPPQEAPLEIYKMFSHSIVALNKIDISQDYLEQYQKIFPIAVPISAQQGKGVDQLQEHWLKDTLLAVREYPFAVLFDAQAQQVCLQAQEFFKRQQFQQAATLLQNFVEQN